MATKSLARLAFGLSLLACGCVGQVSDGETSSEDAVPSGSTAQGLTFTRHDASALEGTFALDGGIVRFVATSVEAGHAELHFQINDKVVQYEGLASTDEQEGFFRVNADVAFSAAEKELARSLVDALSQEFGNEASALSLFEASVPKMAQFIADQREGSVISSIARLEFAGADTAREKSLNDDGVTCVKRGKSMSVQYDDKKGAVRTVAVVVGANWGTSACGSGNYDCMGRCSAGCTGFGGGWTLDCLEHDACSHDMCAGGGNRDSNCGDEYSNATWDIFASCSG